MKMTFTEARIASLVPSQEETARSIHRQVEELQRMTTANAEQSRLAVVASQRVDVVIRAIERAVYAVDAAGVYAEMDRKALKMCVKAFELDGQTDEPLPEWAID